MKAKSEPPSEANRFVVARPDDRRAPVSNDSPVAGLVIRLLSPPFRFDVLAGCTEMRPNSGFLREASWHLRFRVLACSCSRASRTKADRRRLGWRAQRLELFAFVFGCPLNNNNTRPEINERDAGQPELESCSHSLDAALHADVLC